jgi:hypothetical protein
MEPAVNIPEIIPAEVAGYCDIQTGECVTLDDKTESAEPAPAPANG